MQSGGKEKNIAKKILKIAGVSIAIGGLLAGTALISYSRGYRTGQKDEQTAIELQAAVEQAEHPELATSSIDDILGKRTVANGLSNAFLNFSLTCGQEEIAFGKDSPIVQSFISGDCAKELTKGFPELSGLMEEIPEIRNSAGQLLEWCVYDVMFVNNGSAYNLIYHMGNRASFDFYKIGSLSKEHASELESRIKELANKQVEDAFSLTKQINLCLDKDFITAMIKGEGGEQIIPSHIADLAYAFERSDEYKNASPSDVVNYLWELANAGDDFLTNVVGHSDGTGELTILRQSKETVFHYTDKDAFQHLTGALENFAGQYELRHPETNLQMMQPQL
ncbi:MAG: hypothetical protein NTZ02_00675 [Candidatus Woesearchaeota archaeon]|nr:hypothetical protein [Candidatus Woesearchaeota archaeon]